VRVGYRCRIILAVCAAVAWLAVTETRGLAVAQGRRTVDSVDVSDAPGERSHAYTGDRVVEGQSSGRRWRATQASFQYEIRVFDDSPLTLLCTFVRSGGPRPPLDVLVEGRELRQSASDWSIREGAPNDEVDVLALNVPEAWTLGKTAVTVTFRARDGRQTPGLLQFRAVQEHLEDADDAGR
jgi:hypothetical protein